MGRSTFIQCYHWTACPAIGFEAELVGVDGQMTTGGWLLILLGCMRWGKLCDYADEHSCLTFGPDTLTTNPYNPSDTPDVLDIVITKDLPSLVHLTSCSSLSSDHLPLIVDTMCRSSFLHPRITMTSGALTGPTSRPAWKTKFRSNQIYTTGWQSTCALRTCSAPS